LKKGEEEGRSEDLHGATIYNSGNGRSEAIENGQHRRTRR